MKLLIRAGADVNAPAEPSYYGSTALEMAVGGNHTNMVTLLISAGFDANALHRRANSVYPSGIEFRPTALQAAAEGNHEKIDIDN